MTDRGGTSLGMNPGDGCRSCELTELLEGAGRGDVQAFERLYDRVAPRLFGAIVALVRDRSIAEDVLQETMLRVWRRASTYDRNLSDPFVWLLLIARGKSIDAIRRRESASSIARRLGAQSIEFNDPKCPVRSDDQDAAVRALASLPAEQCDLLVLAFQGGLTGPEIARHRGLPLGTVKSRLRAGLVRLRDLFARPAGVTP